MCCGSLSHGTGGEEKEIPASSERGLQKDGGLSYALTSGEHDGYVPDPVLEEAEGELGGEEMAELARPP